MSYPVPDYAQIQSNILRDISNQIADADTGSDSDYAIRAAAEAAAIEGIYAHQQWIYNQIFPDLMDSDQLIQYGGDRGLTLKSATAAIGTAIFTGQVGADVPLGTQASYNGITFSTTVDATIGSAGSVDIPITDMVAESAGNLPVDTSLSLISPPAGINSSASISIATSGGSDIETPAAFLSRVLYRLQNPPQGGSFADYEIWATDTPGCGTAWVYGQRFAANSVDIVILDTNGNAATTALISAVQANIDANRPVTASNCLVSSPTSVAIDISATLTLATNASLETIQSQAQTSFETYFASLAPGDTVIFYELSTLLKSISGVLDLSFTTPTANVLTVINTTEIQRATLGTVSLT